MTSVSRAAGSSGNPTNISNDPSPNRPTQPAAGRSPQRDGHLSGLASLNQAAGGSAPARPTPREPTALEIRHAQRLLKENQQTLAQNNQRMIEQSEGDPHLYQRLSTLAEHRGSFRLQDYVDPQGNSSGPAKAIKRADKIVRGAIRAAEVVGFLTIDTLAVSAHTLEGTRARQQAQSNVFRGASQVHEPPPTDPEGVPSDAPPAYGANLQDPVLLRGMSLPPYDRPETERTDG